MAHLAPGTRPQTLRQAKRAYRKSSAKPKLSASEIAMAERRAVLQERADRIKEREARRKANLRRKEERKEAERERLMREGKTLPPPHARGFKVGPSQLDLARFLPGVVKGGVRVGDGMVGKGGFGGDESFERRGVLEQGMGDGSGSQHCSGDIKRASHYDDRAEDGEHDGARIQPNLEKQGISFDLFDDGDEREGQEKSELACQPDSDAEKKQFHDTDRLSYDLGAGTVNRLDVGDQEGALTETQQRWKMGRDHCDEIRPKASATSRSLLRDQWTGSAKRLRLETESIKTQSVNGYDSPEQVKQTEARSHHFSDKNQPISAPSRRSPLKERCTNSIQRHSFENCKASKAMPPPPPPRPPPTIVSITSLGDDFFPSNTQVEREISPNTSKKHQTTFVKSPHSQAKTLPILQPLPEVSHDFLASISTQDLDFAGMFTQVAPSKPTLAPRPDHATPVQPQRDLPKYDSTTHSLNLQQRYNEPSHHHNHRQNPPSTPPFNDSLITESELLANISTQDLFSSQTTIPNSPSPSPPPESLLKSSNAACRPSSQFPSHVPPPPPRQKLSAATRSTSFDLDDDGFTADDLASIAVQVELAMSGSSAGTASSAKGDLA